MSKKDGIHPSELVQRIQKVANTYLNMVRSQKGLETALQKLAHLKQDALPRITARAEDPKETAGTLRRAIEAEGQLELAMIIATAALCRKESRGGSFGGHYRSDFPAQDDAEWMKNIILKREKDVISWRTALPEA